MEATEQSNVKPEEEKGEISPKDSNIELRNRTPINLDDEIFPQSVSVKKIKREVVRPRHSWKLLQPIRERNYTAIINESNLDLSIIGQEPWPEDVKLYQHYETEQILLPDNANCLAVQAFLKMCKLDFKVEYKPNADYMSPSGRVPFIKCGLYLVAELEPIVSFVGNKGISLTKHLSATEKSDMRAYMSLVNTVLGNAENYITWVDWPTYSQVTKQRFGSVHPFPLNHILVYKKRRSVIKKLSALGWYNKTIDQVYAEVDQCCQALSERLETSRYFFGDQPCELDAEVFGHVHNILSTPAFPAILKLAEIMCSYPPLMRHCKHIATDYLEFVDADENVVHLSCLTKLSLSPKQISEEKLDEFVFYCDEGKNEFDLEVHDVGSLTNPENTIYHSLFE